MNLCYLSLGSNQKSPERQIRQAIKLIRTLPSTSVSRISSLYWTKAWGLQTQQDFCNAAVEIKTALNPVLLLKWCHKIESRHCRIRKKAWGPRTLDIDIIFYGERTIRTNTLTIPHPYFASRDFVLKPLLEINPNIVF
ncbi:2-amino-4-hydroxy-6-hydroxymethyldihydropteridine diphosphokinase [Legionella shakespearei]|uniref:2-amino-4-hydroxy-6-hydroxymethyldihydropteridine pyrophosphokinase n=1 Tax=Legionella shakespearei DSM 23087 TaxID=1122169 RepID=A0A0W0Z0S5_9GAMM|nr:2-amino-4-hydroxy-6-hydroxymethyldihydropteridine diphosphokinase [Legionella shakespearei]KTD62733.1 2-amino-4-hydroxy-6- hydroxymethyldihydropteridine pyrophosphokinase [Legionella shakespearei DSM 23087]